MNVSAWSIRNPVPALLLFMLLTLLGLGSFHRLGIQHFPDIELPTISISARLEGTAPSQLESEVARKIEDQIATLGAIENIRTTLTDGVAKIIVEFDIDKDAETALNEVRNAVDAVRAELPQDLTDPVVSKVTVAGQALLTFIVEADHQDETDLSWFVDNEVAKAMLAVPGVGRFARVGGVDREIRVELNPVKMAALGVTAAEISSGLLRMQQDASGGRGDVGGHIQSLRTLGAVPTAAALENLFIPLGANCNLALSSVAHVQDSIAERDTLALSDGQPVIGFEITRLRGASEVAVAEAVRHAISTFNERFPGIRIREAFNTLDPVVDNYQGSMQLLFEGALLAVLVVWWFLRDWRATFVAATALPLSIIPTFLVMQAVGFSLNTLTLLALALVVGILVDDAIVEVENIVRHLRMGKTPYQAAMEAADEIGLAVIATTFTLVAVFLPTAFMGGIPGKFFFPFGMTAATSVLASLVVARLLTPMMAAYLLKPHPEVHHPPAWLTLYRRLENGCLKRRKITILAALAFFIGSLQLIPLLPTGFVPAADRGQSIVRLELPPGSTLTETHALVEQAIQRLSSMPEIRHIFAVVGSAMSNSTGPMGGGSSRDVRQATLTLSLVHRHQRQHTQTQVEQAIRVRLRALPGAHAAILSSEPGERLQVVLASDDPQALQPAAEAVERDLRSLQGIGNISSSASLQRPELQIQPDFARAAELGVTSAIIASTLRIASNGDYPIQLAKLNVPQRQIPIRVRFDPTWRTDLDNLRQLPLPAPGGQIPLATVASLHLSSGPIQIDRLDRLRNVTIDVELGGRIIGEVMAEVEQLPAIQALPSSVQRPNTGDAKIMAELFGSFGTAMLIGVLCIYIVLVLLFHDFLQPVTILAALPLSLGGAFVALLATHNAFSMPSVIGLLMLMGIVTKNSILLVEYAVKARLERGLDRWAALLDAGQKRARPIIMTTIAMGAGMLPIAMGLGAEPSFRSPMAIAVIGGLLTSTLLSLLVIPVVYTLMDDLVSGLRRLLGWRGQ